jgi:asparagine synthase (glutamine-hydrolysing)
MCGIAGVFVTGSGRAQLDEPLLGRMTDSLAHRGPDDRGIHLDRAAGIGLGHRRLSIIDLSPLGHQPMASDDGATWIVYNGEVYNHGEIRAELEASGVRFRSRTDTEVILKLYQREGERCLSRLNGMFAFAIWDARKRRLFLARDRIGVKPLYWSQIGSEFLFASEVRALLEHPALGRDMDEESLWHNLTFLTTPAPRTLFRDVSKLPGGHWMRVDQGGVHIERWWDPLDAPRLAPEAVADKAEVARAVRGHLATAVRDRMMSDVPFGVFLSGGVDSSANVALMAECSSQPINTFSVGYAGAGVGHLNELEHARRIAERHGTNHHEVMVDHRSLLDYLPDLIEHLDDPVFDPVCVPLYYVSRLARQNGVKVVQVGEGSDELFVGYTPWLQAIRFSERLRLLRKAPGWVRRAATNVAVPALRGVGGQGLGRAYQWAELLRRAVDEDVFWGGAVLLSDGDKASLAPKLGAGRSSWSVLQGYYDEIDRRWPNADTVQRMSYVELRQRLPELLLSRVDRITMSVSIEGREPFLDHRLVEYALRLPQRMKTHSGITKAILKRAVADLLPHDLLHRRKQGFPAPIATWMFEDEFGRVLKETLRTSPLVRDGYLDGQIIAAYLEEHYGHRYPRDGILWTLFCLTLWYKRWILRERTLFS